MSRLSVLFAAPIVLASYAMAEQSHQPYAGYEGRDIASLSDQDIEALENGTGWGLALPAELNGYPGPAHVLELAEALGLTDAQTAQVESVFGSMRAEAIEKGMALIEAERALDAGFKAGSLDAPTLRRLIEEAERARADLRFVHLSRHLATLALLDAEQVAQYAVLRGYADDPCASVPEGHDATKWRRHNGCGDQ